MLFLPVKHYVTPRAKQLTNGSKDLPVNLKPQNILADQVRNYLRMLFRVHFLLENDNQPKAIPFLMLNTLFSFFHSLICVSFLRVAQIADAIAVTETTSSSLSSSTTSSRSSTPKVMSCYSEKHQIVLF